MREGKPIRPNREKMKRNYQFSQKFFSTVIPRLTDDEHIQVTQEDLREPKNKNIISALGGIDKDGGFTSVESLRKSLELLKKLSTGKARIFVFGQGELFVDKFISDMLNKYKTVSIGGGLANVDTPLAKRLKDLPAGQYISDKAVKQEFRRFVLVKNKSLEKHNHHVKQESSEKEEMVAQEEVEPIKSEREAPKGLLDIFRKKKPNNTRKEPIAENGRSLE